MRCVTFPQLERAGRLANQLFQIASSYGIADSRREPLSLNPRWSYRPYFNVPGHWFGRATGTPAWQLPEAAHLGQAALYLQDPALFAHVADKVRAAFQPSERAERHLGWNDRWDDAIAVHVRRGDLLTQEPGFQPALTVDAPDYYRTALDVIDPMGVMPVVVFSDDPDWCEVNMPTLVGRSSVDIWQGKPRSHIPREYRNQTPMDWVDLQLMSRFPHIVMSNSTYAWWSAWLNECPDVLYPSRWYGEKLSYINTDLLFVDLGWRRVECG